MRPPHRRATLCREAPPAIGDTLGLPASILSVPRPARLGTFPVPTLVSTVGGAAFDSHPFSRFLRCLDLPTTAIPALTLLGVQQLHSLRETHEKIARVNLEIYHEITEILRSYAKPTPIPPGDQSPGQNRFFSPTRSSIPFLSSSLRRAPGQRLFAETIPAGSVFHLLVAARRRRRDRSGNAASDASRRGPVESPI